MIKKIIFIIRNTSKNIVFNIPLIIILLIALLLIVTPNKSDIQDRIHCLLASLLFQTAGFSGVIMIIRKEGPGFITNKKFSILYGVVTIVFSLPVAIFFFVCVFLP